MINQLTYDPMTGMSSQLPTDGAVILAWTDGEAVPVEIVGETPRRTGNTLYYLPTRVAISGPTTFTLRPAALHGHRCGCDVLRQVRSTT